MADDESLPEETVSDIVASLFPVPGAGPLWRKFVGQASAEWRRNSSEALRAAGRASGLSREDFAEWLAAEPRAVPLYLRILWAAGMNGHDEVLRGMGAVLGKAAEATRRGSADDFDDAELALRAMENLTKRHFVVLAALLESKTPSDRLLELGPEYVSRRTDLPEAATNQCLLNLAAAGLTTQISTYDGFAYPVTELGRAVASAAREASSD